MGGFKGIRIRTAKVALLLGAALTLALGGGQALGAAGGPDDAAVTPSPVVVGTETPPWQSAAPQQGPWYAFSMLTADRESFSPRTGLITISYGIPAGVSARIEVVSRRGTVVRTLMPDTNIAEATSGTIAWDGRKSDGELARDSEYWVTGSSRSQTGWRRTYVSAMVRVDTSGPMLWGPDTQHMQSGERFQRLRMYASEHSNVMVIARARGKVTWRQPLDQERGGMDVTVPVPSPWAKGGGLECKLSDAGSANRYHGNGWGHHKKRRRKSERQLRSAIAGLKRRGLFKKTCSWSVETLAVDDAGNTSSRTVAYTVRPNEKKAIAAIKAWVAGQRTTPRRTTVPTPSGPAGKRVLPAWLHPVMLRATAGAGVPRNWATKRALYNILLRESSFNPRAQNPTSTAFGLFQFLNSTWATVNCTKTSDAYRQSVCGLRYIKRRYGTPEAAWRFWQQNHWY